jgi:hypothetical protein
VGFNSICTPYSSPQPDPNYHSLGTPRPEMKRYGRGQSYRLQRHSSVTIISPPLAASLGPTTISKLGTPRTPSRVRGKREIAESSWADCSMVGDRSACGHREVKLPSEGETESEHNGRHLVGGDG